MRISCHHWHFDNQILLRLMFVTFFDWSKECHKHQSNSWNVSNVNYSSQWKCLVLTDISIIKYQITYIHLADILRTFQSCEQPDYQDQSIHLLSFMIYLCPIIQLKIICEFISVRCLVIDCFGHAMILFRQFKNTRYYI